MVAQQLQRQQSPRSDAAASFWTKFRAQEEIEKSQAILAFEEIRGPIQVDRHGVGWSHFERWSTADAPSKAAMIIQERRRQMETERIALAVQQSQQGQWNEDGMRSSKDPSHGKTFGECLPSVWHS